MTCGREVVIVASRQGVGTWLEAELRRFLGNKTRLYVCTALSRGLALNGSSVVVSADTAAQADAGALPARYSLTRRAWRTLVDAAGVSGRVGLSANGDVQVLLKEALAQVGHWQLAILDSAQAATTTELDCVLVCHGRNRDPAAPNTVSIDPPEVAPATILRIVRLLHGLDSRTHVALEKHIGRVYPQIADVEAALACVAASPVDPNVTLQTSDKNPDSSSARDLANILGESAAINRSKRIVERVSKRDLPVLILGESGTGKELFAQALHNLSSRSQEPFLTLNCAAITESLLEAELFGYEDGAFTGARKGGRPGLFEAANRGTVFLDEVGDLSLPAQATLLRVLEQREVMRVGGRRTIPVDIRIVAATNHSLEAMVTDGHFRRDLYHRLCVVPLWVPPLRERHADIALLAQASLHRLGDRRSLPQEVLDCLYRYRWPGNVRELQHCIEYMVAVTDEAFALASLPPQFQPYIDAATGESAMNNFSSNMVRFPNHHNNQADGHCMTGLREDCEFVLATIDSANRTGVGIGRRALADKARQQGLALTEGAVRTRLAALRSAGFVDWGRGRAGVYLTAKGTRAIRQLRQ